jgi:adenine phosphoribosyltransferase
VNVVDSARAALSSSFVWTEGHADFSRVFADARTLSLLGPALVHPFLNASVSAIVGIEARGFVLGALCAQSLGTGLVLARKPGSVHPGDKVEKISGPDWRGRRIPIRLVRTLSHADRVLLVDDWVQTGSQARAAKAAVEECGSTVVGTTVLVDDTNDSAREELHLSALVRSADLGPSDY